MFYRRGKRLEIYFIGMGCHTGNEIYQRFLHVFQPLRRRRNRRNRYDKRYPACSGPTLLMRIKLKPGNLTLAKSTHYFCYCHHHQKRTHRTNLRLKSKTWTYIIIIIHEHVIWKHINLLLGIHSSRLKKSWVVVVLLARSVRNNNNGSLIYSVWKVGEKGVGNWARPYQIVQAGVEDIEYSGRNVKLRRAVRKKIDSSYLTNHVCWKNVCWFR